VVAVLHKRPDPRPRAPLTIGARRWLWVLLTLDVMVSALMVSAGDWLDTASRLTAVVTLGGHHWIVLTLAVIGFALLAGLATATRGYAEVSDVHGMAAAFAGVLSIVALAGVLAVGMIVLVVALLTVLVTGRRLLHLLSFGLL
jgi:hypothetical protein